MGGLQRLVSGWTVAACLAAAVTVGFMWTGLPVIVLVGAAGLFAFLTVVFHSPTALNARRLALGGVGLAWMVAPFTGLKVGGGLAVPEVALAVAALVAWLPPRRKMRPHQALRAPAIGYVALIVIGGVIGSVVEDSGLGSYVYLARLVVSGIGALFILRRFNPTERELRWLTLAWCGGALLSAMVGFTGVAASGRAVGLTGHSNQFSMMCAMAIPLVMVLASRSGFASTERPSPYLRAGMVAGVGILVGATVLSGSRSGLISVVAVLILIAYRYLGMAIAVTVGVFGVSALLLSGLPQAIISGEAATSENAAIARLSSGDDTSSSNDERGMLLQNQIAELAEGSALWGRGFAIGELGLRSHNIWLEVWGGAGLLGLIGLLGLTLPVLRYALRRRREVNPMVIAVAIGFIGYLVAMTFNNAFDLPYAWTFYALFERWRAVDEPTDPINNTS